QQSERPVHGRRGECTAGALRLRAQSLRLVLADLGRGDLRERRLSAESGLEVPKLALVLRDSALPRLRREITLDSLRQRQRRHRRLDARGRLRVALLFAVLVERRLGFRLRRVLPPRALAVDDDVEAPRYAFVTLPLPCPFSYLAP